MGYIEEIRHIIGHRLLVMVGAGVLVVDSQGRLLLGRRTDNNCWGIPGGALEPGETLEEAACREAREETGLELRRLELFGVFSGPEFLYIYPSGDQAYNVSIIYECQEYQGKITLSGEHSTFQFFDPVALPEPLSPPIRPIISRWLEKQSRLRGLGQVSNSGQA